MPGHRMMNPIARGTKDGHGRAKVSGFEIAIESIGEENNGPAIGQLLILFLERNGLKRINRSMKMIING